MVKENIIRALKEVIQELGLSGEITLDHPANPDHGDYASNIALIAFARVKGRGNRGKWKNPIELAREIAKPLTLNPKPYLDRVEIAPPGFINFWLAKEYLISSIIRIIEEKERFAQQELLRGQKIMVEFTDPNPFKEFHIGHLRNITLGESLCRLLESQGAQVWRVNYQGDVGMHVAKAIYGIMKNESGIMNKKNLSLREKVKLLGECYAVGNKAYEENDGAKKEIQALNLKIYRGNPEIHALWQMGRKWSLDYFEEIYKRVGTKYNHYYFESEVAGPGREIVLANIKNRIFERHEGAVVFRGKKEGFHTRVFITKEDYATYEAKDMALAGIKYKDFLYDRSIIITAHEQGPYFKVVLAAMRQVFPKLAQKTQHLSFGFVRLKDTKMSSRLGNIITGEWLLDEAKARIKKEFSEMDDKTAEEVAVGAVKYSMLKFATASDISFSFEESINLEGSSGPYLQYTYARTQSVLRKGKGERGKGKTLYPIPYTLYPEELALLRTLCHFPEVVEEAAENFAPNLLCNYLFELSQAFNLFYQKHKILESKEREFRLALTSGVGQTLKNGLYFLGIKSPEKM